ncbi:MAG: tetratricopeptide repeat protein [Proteobacteria bacterium]|nr:tetratricopeptide repeat protein [Pseudomonadota bacterium]
MLKRILPQAIIPIFLAGILALSAISVFAAENVLLEIEHTPKGKNLALLSFHSESPPDFEIFENLKKRIFIVKFRQTTLGGIQRRVTFRDSLLGGIEVLKVEEEEYWLKIKTEIPDLLYKIEPRKKDSKTLTIRFYKRYVKPVQLPGIEITSILRELRPRSETITVFSKKPLQYDISRDKTKPGKRTKIRFLNARLTKDLIVPDAETDIIQYVKFEKRGKYLNMMFAPQKYTLRIKTRVRRDPISLVFTVSENKNELVATPEQDLKEIEQKEEEENVEKQKKDRYLTLLLEDAEKFHKLGRFEKAGLKFKNIYNFAPKTEIGVRANFRAADSFFQNQRGKQEKNGELFVIQEYKSAINSAIGADLGYENIPRAYYNMGRSYLILKFYEDAFNQFEIVLQKYPASPYSRNAWFHQGVIHLNMERYEKSIEALEKFVEENATSPWIHAAYYKIGESQFQLKQYKEAKKNFDKAWSINAAYMKKDAELMFHMGEAYFENEDYNTARALYEQLLDLYPREPFSNLVAIRIGDFLREENKEDDAIKAYEEAVNVYPKELSLIGKMRIANILAEKPGKDHHRKALEYYDFILTRHRYSDQLEEAMLRKALTLSLFHYYSDAISSLEEFCKEFPDNIYVKNHILHNRILELIRQYVGEYYFKGEYLNALGVYEQYETQYYQRPQYSACFIRKKEDDLKKISRELIKKAPLFLIADSYYRLGLQDKALAHNEIILKNPDDPLASVALFNQGKLYDSKDQPGKAQEIFMKFIRVYPEHVYTPQVKKTLGDSYFKVHKSDRITRAIRIYRQTIRDYQDSDNMLEREIIPSCWFALGNLYQGIGRYDASINAYKKVLSSYEHPLQSMNVDETIIETYFILGNLYLELNQLPEAMEIFNQAIRLFPDSDKTPWAKYHKGEIFVKNNEKDKALIIFEELMEAAKKSPDALWGPMARDSHQLILNDLKFDKYLKRTPGAGKTD